MKYTLVSDNQSTKHLVTSDSEVTACGLPFTGSEDYWNVERVVYNKDTFEEAVAEYMDDSLCEICFPSENTATFETKATFISEEDAGDFIEPAKGVRI